MDARRIMIVIPGNEAGLTIYGLLVWLEMTGRVRSRVYVTYVVIPLPDQARFRNFNSYHVKVVLRRDLWGTAHLQV